jgi:hypothetical protein
LSASKLTRVRDVGLPYLLVGELDH